MCVSQEESRKLLPIAEMGKKLSFGLVACSSVFLQVGDPPLHLWFLGRWLQWRVLNCHSLIFFEISDACRSLSQIWWLTCWRKGRQGEQYLHQKKWQGSAQQSGLIFTSPQECHSFSISSSFRLVLLLMIVFHSVDQGLCNPLCLEFCCTIAAGRTLQSSFSTTSWSADYTSMLGPCLLQKSVGTGDAFDKVFHLS